jgi:hypothetical protein
VVKILLEIRILEVTIRGIFVVYFLPQTVTSPSPITAGVAVCGRIRRMLIGYSAGNCQGINWRKVILPGITSLWTRNPLEEM